MHRLRLLQDVCQFRPVEPQLALRANHQINIRLEPYDGIHFLHLASESNTGLEARRKF
jgi:hypothetical protein